MIKGFYFNGKSSGKQSASLFYNKEGQIALSENDKADISHKETGNAEINNIKFADLEISSRLGNTPRYISFADGAQFETDNNDAVDKMVIALSNKKLNGLAHKLEKAKAFILFTLVTVVLFGWLVIQYGIPYFSRAIAEVLPEKASLYLGQGVLEVMDKSWFKKSELPEKKQNELRQLFNRLLKNVDGNENYQLEFRLGGEIKANAFALPSGIIVFTDELIDLAENNLEIAAIMLHEIGHLKNNHSLRATLQQFSLGMLVMLVTGDVSTSSSIITAIPIMLVESGFSKAMEIEADNYSFAYMRKHNINPNHFAVIMEKLEASLSPEFSKCKESESRLKCIKEVVRVAKTKENNGNIMDYFSTHPAVKERIKRFKSAE
jgi:Zn-dependent protease with chaperone function